MCIEWIYGKPIFLPSVYTKPAHQPLSYDHAEDGKNKKKKEEEAITERFRMLESEMVFDNIKKQNKKQKSIRAYPVNCSILHVKKAVLGSFFFIVGGKRKTTTTSIIIIIYIIQQQIYITIAWVCEIDNRIY